MRVVLFLSRFTFVCNIAFLLFVLFSWIETKMPATTASDSIVQVPFVKELVVVLGFTAIFINLIMNIIYVFLLFSRRLKVLPRWLIFANILFLVAQFTYFFLIH